MERKKIYGKKSDESQENDIIDFLKRFPLSGDYNLLIAKDSKNISTDFKNIISYIENNNPKTILVLSFTNNVDKRKKIYKSSLKNGVVFESKKIYDNQVYNWIQEQCKSKSLNLHPNSIKIIEAYPTTPTTERLPDSFAWIGLYKSFERAGFEIVDRTSVNRPMVRYYIDKDK